MINDFIYGIRIFWTTAEKKKIKYTRLIIKHFINIDYYITKRLTVKFRKGITFIKIKLKNLSRKRLKICSNNV